MSASNPAGEAKPVALLGRAGPARERLREALALAGAHVVLEDEPAAVDAQALRDAEPVAVLVALEPAIEDALDALEPALSAPGLTVIFDEADLAARREGWDAQRWARHLAAKLHGHGDVLPPGAEVEPAFLPEPGLPVTPAQLHSHHPVDAHLEAAAFELDRVPGDALFDPVDVPGPGAGPAVVAAPAPVQALGDSSTWGLVDVAVDETPRVARDFSDLATGDLALVAIEEEESGSPAGAVLVIAGIGGPDAIRRLLSALPAEFPRAVLVRMALNGGQYGNLVRQMGRVSTLPVELGEAGLPIRPGKVYILSDGVSVAEAEGGLAFVAGDDAAALVASLPAADSAVLLLSGASETLVESVLAAAQAGAWVAGQSVDGCYDPAAASRLALHGRPTADPSQLAQALAERWPA
ncbi:chemotaxis protein CheB [Pseudomonas sp. Hp2]|uniref:chemotaxis protein CheB n=1 Tax=Pseudomonas sp. Hp2 TaxID=701189 RepID=UPI001C498EAD|nr:chemotaxis protein CheB [Pseudomonas sp. Hp2]